jgi:hypothetical protein
VVPKVIEATAKTLAVAIVFAKRIFVSYFLFVVPGLIA